MPLCTAANALSLSDLPIPSSSCFSLTDRIPIANHNHKARDHRPLVQAAVLQAISLLLTNLRREEALHFLLSQNWLNDLLAAFDEGALLLAVEEVREGVRPCGWCGLVCGTLPSPFPCFIQCGREDDLVFLPCLIPLSLRSAPTT